MKLIEEDFEETYGMRPKIVGREYLLDIGTLLKKADEYPETLAILENDSFVLRREYYALNRFYGKMEARHVINGDDFFDEMI